MAFNLPDLNTEDQLMARARRGDQAAIMQIYDLYFPAVYQFIRMRVDDARHAEDLSSDVFVRLIDAFRGRNAPSRSLRGWLFRVARRELGRHFDRERRFTTEAIDEWISLPDGDEMEVQFIREMSAERARHAIQRLSTDQQEVLLLRFGQGLSLEETADVMGKNLGAIKSLQFRAVNALRLLLGEGEVNGRA
ncbi:MAG: sigma-70 family RNA polymerase sigma factor [Anaerolineae bacterium]|nr:sigma-70 family RNA polymerase sigma factor [Anaerolineae bacterium]